MGRIDDDIEDRRNAERLLQQQLQEQQVAAKKKTDGSEFDRRMSENTIAQASAAQKQSDHDEQRRQEQRRNPVPSEILREAKEKAKDNLGKLVAAAKAGQRNQETRAGHRQSERHSKDIREQRGHDANQLAEKQHGNDLTADQRVGRRADGFKFGEELQHSRTDSESQDSQATEGTARADAAESRGTEKAGGDGQSKGGGQGDHKGGDGAPPQFRLNPALLAPPPLARPRDDARTEKLRKLAAEIAQKIVERARVGQNAAGQTEFQMDLRSNVLSGLHIRVSASKGRISALFSGNDRKVLAMLKESSGSLKEALQARGLTLVDLKVEVRT